MGDMADFYMGDLIVDDAIRQFQERAYEEKIAKLDDMTDAVFIDYVLEKGDRDKLNNAIEGGKFPAYDIAEKIKKNGWTPTQKQRAAITNVYVRTRQLEN